MLKNARAYPLIKECGMAPYEPIWQAMREFTLKRDSNTLDEIWIVEHPPVFTQGTAGKPEYIIDPHDIPVVMSDRGGQVTYHGPGQWIIYLLLNLNRLHLGIRALVNQLEQGVINYLTHLNIQQVARKEGAPGVYVLDKKICSIGLRVRKGFTYHGLSFNANMDLTPFSYIYPCGYKNLKVTQLKDLHPLAHKQKPKDILTYLLPQLGYTLSSLYKIQPTTVP